MSLKNGRQKARLTTLFQRTSMYRHRFSHRVSNDFFKVLRAIVHYDNDLHNHFLAVTMPNAMGIARGSLPLRETSTARPDWCGMAGRLDFKYRQDQLFVGVWSRH